MTSSPQTTPLKVGLAGLGTVGTGVVKLLAENASLIARRAGRPIQVTAVCARDRSRHRRIDLGAFQWEDDAQALIARDDVDVVVELIGGADGPALTLARGALSAGKPFVTANKAMLAHHGMALAELAEASATALKFEAAVAGGIPVIKGLREGAAANQLSRVYGILNGTCNYILTRMEKEGLEFYSVLSDAQRLGYAEADPSFDIDGVDAAHKLAILATLAFGSQTAFNEIEAHGIRDITLSDIRQAAAFGCRVRLVGEASALGNILLQRVHPMLVPMSHPLSAIEGPLNAVVAEGNFVGRLLFSGPGAGEGPTASAVVADLIDIARGEDGPAFAMPVAALGHFKAATSAERLGRYYLRLSVRDRPGVLADLTAALRDAGVSIESLIQPASTTEELALVVMLTHEVAEEAVVKALSAMSDLPAVCGKSLMMPVLPTDA